MAAGEEKLKLVLDAIDRTAAPLRKVNRRIEGMLAPIRKVKRAFRSLAVESGLPKLGKGLASAGRFARNFAFAGVAAGVGLFELVRRTAESSEELAKLGRQLGISTTDFQELKFAADRVGVSNSDFTKGIGSLGKRVGELKADTGPLATLLKKVSPALAEQLKGATDTGEALEVMIGALARLEDPLKKNALAAAAFGRAGQSMVRLSNEGAESIGALREEARRLGGVLDLESANAAEEVIDSLTNLKFAATGLAQRIGVQLFPVFKDITGALTEWIVANRELVLERVTTAVGTLVARGRELFETLRVGVPKVLEFVKQIGGLKTIAIAVGVVLAATVLAPLIAIGLALGPVGILVVGIGAGFVAAGLRIAKAWAGIKETIIGTIDAIISKAQGLIPRIPAPVRRLFGLEDSSGQIAPIAIAGAGAVQGAAGADGAPGAARADVGGRISIELLDGRARIVNSETNSPDLELDLAGGEALSAA